MSDTEDDYEIIDGIRWSQLTEPLICEEVISTLQFKVDDIANQLKLAAENFHETGQPSDPKWRAAARFALSCTRDEIRRIRNHQRRLTNEIKAQRAKENNSVGALSHAEKMERIAAANARTQDDLSLFKEEVKRRISAAEYDDIWRCVRAAKATQVEVEQDRAA